MNATPAMSPLPAPISALFRAMGNRAFLGGRQAFVTLTFHRVLERPDPLLPFEPDATAFAARMDVLANHFNVLPLRDAWQRLRSGTLPPRSVCVTFDDGYRNNLEVAVPILKSRNMPATVFVAPGFSSGGMMFNDIVLEAIRAAREHLNLGRLGLGEHGLQTTEQRVEAASRLTMKLKYLPSRDRVPLAREIADEAGLATLPLLMMNHDQLRALRAEGIDVGAHTMTHPILKNLSIQDACDEITRSKTELERILGCPVTAFAYPNGKPGDDYDSRHVAAVRNAGFDLALTTAWGAAGRASDPFQLPRIAPWDTTAARYIARILSAFRSPQVAQA